METIRVMIAEDEPLARKRLKRLLSGHADMNLVAEAADGMEALALLQSTPVDLLLLDVQMPELDGFEVLAKLDELPFVVFVTAYDRYAIQAFNVHAIDYLLKPYDNDRFNEALDLARRHMQLKHPADLKGKLRKLIHDHHQQEKAADYRHAFSFKKSGRIVEVKTEDIHFLEASGNYLTLHTNDAQHLYRGSLSAIGAELDPNRFLKIHRSYVINADHVKSVRYLNNNEYKFTMNNGSVIVSGRSHKEMIMAFLSEKELL